ncbi:MAG: hypothetical protein JWP35_3216 [Caulobacter sp.]|nr:hypothetical protein [Caulobacter sp.]
MFIRLAAALMALSLGVTASAIAAQPGNNVQVEAAVADQAYAHHDYDAAIAALDRLLAAPDATAEQRAAALQFRANIRFLNKHDPAGAIADMDAALALFPDNADWLIYRGAYRSSAGQPALALVDFNRAIALRPDAWQPHRARGLALLHLLRFQEAADDLRQALTVNPDLPFVALELHIARLRMGQDDGEAFARDTTRFDMNRWPGPIIAFYQGRLSGEVLLAMATADLSLDRPEQRCEASYYVGEAALAAGDRARARTLFRAAKATCPMEYSEWSGAVAELTRLR